MIPLSLARSRRRWTCLPAGARSLGVLAIAAALGCHRSSGPPRQQPPVPVLVEPAQVRPVPLEIPAIGSATPLKTIAVRAHLSGTLDRVYFEEGDEVTAGQPLFLIDPRPFRLALEQARANLARDEAQLRSAGADARRYGELLPQGIVSRQDYDQKVAQAGALRATVTADQIAIDTARVNLGYTLIPSPITGRASYLQIDQGNLIKADDTSPMVVIRQMRPIYVSFSVPAVRLPEIRQQAERDPLRVLADVPGRRSIAGTLTFIDNAVDTTTGTILLKASFPNEDEALWPGQFVNVRLVLATLPDAVVVPARSVQPGQQGDHVFIIGADDVAQSRRVKVGERLGGDVVVEGVRPAERVVTDGILGLVPGVRVQIQAPAAGPGHPQARAQAEQGPASARQDPPPRQHGTQVQGRRP